MHNIHFALAKIQVKFHSILAMTPLHESDIIDHEERQILILITHHNDWMTI